MVEFNKYYANRLLTAMAGLTPTPEKGYLGQDGGIGSLCMNVEEVCKLVHDGQTKLEDIRAGLEGDRDVFHRTFCEKIDDDQDMYRLKGHCIVCRMLQIHIDLIDGKERPNNE